MLGDSPNSGEFSYVPLLTACGINGLSRFGDSSFQKPVLERLKTRQKRRGIDFAFVHDLAFAAGSVGAINRQAAGKSVADPEVHRKNPHKSRSDD
jgi:hypothetical protein